MTAATDKQGDRPKMRKVTLNIEPRTVASLDRLTREAGGVTAAVNEALRLHAALLPYMPGGHLQVVAPDGTTVLLQLV